MAAEPNITVRKKPLSQSLEIVDIIDSLDCSQSSDRLGQSLDLSTSMFSGYVEEMKSEITALKSNLKSTQNEMDNIILENVDLKNQISQLSQEILILKQICSSPASTLNRRTLTKKHVSSSRKNSVKRRITDNFCHSPTTQYQQEKNNNSSAPPTPFPGSDNTKDQRVEKQVAVLSQQLLKRKSEILCNKPEQPPKKKKFCFLSTDPNYHVLTTAQRILIKDNDEICHYLTPKVGIEHLLREIDLKLSDFTNEDYCIVLIGQEDFKTTKDYLKMIISIRDVLKTITHTNVILCSPTYILRSHNSLYNARIETFNNLLCLDLLAHEHAYFLDSNKNLKADFSMFNKNTGLINNKAIRTVFEDLKALIDDIDHTNIEYLNELSENIDIQDGTDENGNNSCNENMTGFFRN